MHLLASKGRKSRAKVTTQDLIEAYLSFRPYRIIMGKLRGAEAYNFLRAMNTVHPDSILTLYADCSINGAWIAKIDRNTSWTWNATERN